MPDSTFNKGILPLIKQQYEYVNNLENAYYTRWTDTGSVAAETPLKTKFHNIAPTPTSCAPPILSIPTKGNETYDAPLMKVKIEKEKVAKSKENVERPSREGI